MAKRVVWGALAFIAVIALWRWQSTDYFENERVLVSDAYAYYPYLPAAFVYGDLRLRQLDTIPELVRHKYWVHSGINGSYLPKMTMGVALCQTPAFLIALGLNSALSDEKIHGWEPIFQAAMAVNGLLWLLFGIWFLIAYLGTRYRPTVAIFTALSLYFGTNLLYYSIEANAISHTYTFALLSITLWLSTSPTLGGAWRWPLFGLLAGLVVLIRPVNILLLLWPAFEVWRCHPELGRNWRQWVRPLTTVAITALLVQLPQLAYWKLCTGQWIYYSYGKEGFFFNNPQIAQGLFSFRNGLLIYVPLLWLALAGWWLMAHRVLWLLVTGCFFYVVFSWWCWYYGDSFGIRAVIEWYPLAALPLAAAFEKAFERRITTVAVALFVLACVGFSLRSALFYSQGILSGSRMTKAAFIEIFTHWEAAHYLDNAGVFIDPDLTRLKAGLPERTVRDTVVLQPLGCLELAPGGIELKAPDSYSETMAIQGKGIETVSDKVIAIRASVDIRASKNTDAMLVSQWRRGEQVFDFRYRQLQFAAEAKEPDEVVSFYVEKPLYMADSAVLEVFVWMRRGSGFIRVNSLCAEWWNCPYVEP